MKAIKIILAGIILILSSLFFMGICIINAQKGMLVQQLITKANLVYQIILDYPRRDCYCLH